MDQVYTPTDIYKTQRTEKGLEYDRRRAGFRRKMLQRDPDTIAAVKAVGEELWNAKAVSPGTVHANTFLTNLSVQYANDDYIGERLMPIVPVDKRSDLFAIYDKRDRLGLTDDSIGPRGDVNEVDENRTSDNYSVRDRALQNFIPAETIANQDAIFDEMLDLNDAVSDGLALNREIRIAAVLTTAANFPGQTVTLSGADQWNHSSGGDPIGAVQSAVAGLWHGKGQTDLVGYTSLDVLNVLVRHAKFLELFKYTEGGLVTRQQLAGIFGLSDLLVGAARQDTANRGQAASYGRIWGKDFGIVRVARRPSKRSAHFASTFQLREDPQTFSWFDPKKGKAGGHYLKIGQSDDHRIVAADTGYLIKAAIL